MIGKIKKYGREGVALAVTGMGLSALAGVDSSGAAGKMAKAMPIVGGVVAARMVVDTTKGLLPKKRMF